MQSCTNTLESFGEMAGEFGTEQNEGSESGVVFVEAPPTTACCAP